MFWFDTLIDRVSLVFPAELPWSLIISRRAEEAPCLISHKGLKRSLQSSTQQASKGHSSS